ncbi:hypothetical protein UCRPA7_8432 [Phaeoacremonium minimum UCRPA7]|uniref:Uncharacterized protein n=1 Tax=Phaeoacremonium minimum (strain UCR-PA7) TaxID=1286976 RepID=R8B9V9_PHAM7|nr:hypothetical protein UCRPA7_8432 [Phaeoacremonium minimum UCRPA7]EON96078.1 hypothetical protein UCRPA7_8432 [Phaeoacremonium minimum UCRPA7]
MANKTTSALSIVIYLITLIITIVEITKAKLLYDETCSLWSCWAIFIVAWALAIPVAFLSLLREIFALVLSRRSSADHKPSRGRRIFTIGSAVAVFALWLVVLVIGWAPIRFPAGAYSDGTNYYGPPPDVTGVFRYVRALYEEIMPSYHDGYTGEANDLFVLARAGYGAAIMATISLSVLLHSPNDESIVRCEGRCANARSAAFGLF